MLGGDQSRAKSQRGATWQGRQGGRGQAIAQPRAPKPTAHHSTGKCRPTAEGHLVRELSLSRAHSGTPDCTPRLPVMSTRTALAPGVSREETSLWADRLPGMEAP